MQSIQVSTTGINRTGDTGSYRYPTVGDFDAAHAGQTLGQVDAQYAGMTLGEFDAAQKASVAGLFVNQAFGNIAGARVADGEMMLRIRTATTTPAGVDYTAEGDTTLGDLDALWAGKTLGEFDAFWAGKTLGEAMLAPLRYPAI